MFEDENQSKILLLQTVLVQQPRGREHFRCHQIHIREVQSSWRSRVCRRSLHQVSHSSSLSLKVSDTPSSENMSKNNPFDVKYFCTLKGKYFYLFNHLVITMIFRHHFLRVKHFASTTKIRKYFVDFLFKNI